MAQVIPVSQGPERFVSKTAFCVAVVDANHVVAGPIC